VAQALDRTRLYEAERERAAVAEELALVGALLSATLEPATLYARLLEHFSRILPYDHASVLLHEGGWAVVAGSRGRITVPAGLRLFPVADMVLPLAAGDGGRPVLLRDTAGLGWIHLEPFVGAHSIRSVLVVPLLADGQVVGTFNVDSFTPDFYAERHFALAVTLGEHLAQALRNARLHAAERERARVAEELGRLRTVEVTEAAAFEAVGAALNASLEPRALYSLILATRFGRVPGSRIRAGHVGTGLGLYLSRQLAEAMGGDLGLEATGPEGSVFRLRVPLAGT